MKANHRWKAAIGLLVLLVATPTLLAQENTETEEPRVPPKFLFEAEVWFAQPVGTGFTPATQADPSNPLGTSTLDLKFSTEDSFRYRIGWRFSHRDGILFTYWSHDSGSNLTISDPTRFIYGELMVHPLYAGLNNDGLSDGFQAGGFVRMRDKRLDYYRKVFESKSTIGKWYVGWRDVDHDHYMTTYYPALVPNPPLPPGFPTPGVDTGFIESDFRGDGLETGLDVEFLLWKDKLSLETGAGVAVLRGDISSSYTSTTYAYTGDGFPLGPPYDEWTDPDLTISQGEARIGLQSTSTSTTSQVLDLHLGLRWKVLRWFHVFGGFRSTRYDNVVREIRPNQVVLQPDTGLTINLVNVDETYRSVAYEGINFGVAFLAF